MLERELESRERILGELLVAVDDAQHLAAADRATLTADVSNEKTGIGDLMRRLPGAATCAQLKTDARQMIVNFRVDSVMVPQVRLAVAADTETAISGEFVGVIPRLQRAVRSARSRGRNVTAAQASFDALENQVAAAQRDSTGIVATVLGFTPSSYPRCRSTFLAERTSLRDGLTALQMAHTDLRSVVEDLR
ncbi:MAG: hypothetical protein ACYDHU_02695 [Acidimicrobiales bacterium]